MSGISRIQQVVEQRTTNSRQMGSSKELWLKDGDQAFVTPVATGDEDDKHLDAIELYTWREGNRMQNLLKHPNVEAKGLPEEARASRKFAFWGWVHEIIHTNRTKPEWEPVEGPGGRQLFREQVNDYRVIALPFGRAEYIWNQLVDIYGENKGLNKAVLRIKRAGTQFDTSYNIASTSREAANPPKEEVNALASIEDYYLERYGAVWNSQPAINADVKRESYDDLPF